MGLQCMAREDVNKTIIVINQLSQGVQRIRSSFWEPTVMFISVELKGRMDKRAAADAMCGRIVIVNEITVEPRTATGQCHQGEQYKNNAFASPLHSVDLRPQRTKRSVEA